MSHQLYLYIPENTLSTKSLEIIDESVYDPALSITNVVFKIKSPLSSTWVAPKFIIKGRNYYTSNTFGLTLGANQSELAVLPDGIYEVKLTITYDSDDNKVCFETKFLRDSVTRCRVLAKLSDLLVNDCNKLFDCYGNDILDKTIQELKDLLTILDTAIIDARLFKYAEANNKVDYVNKKLNNLNF